MSMSLVLFGGLYAEWKVLASLKPVTYHPFDELHVCNWHSPPHDDVKYLESKVLTCVCDLILYLYKMFLSQH